MKIVVAKEPISEKIGDWISILLLNAFFFWGFYIAVNIDEADRSVWSNGALMLPAFSVLISVQALKYGSIFLRSIEMDDDHIFLRDRFPSLAIKKSEVVGISNNDRDGRFLIEMSGRDDIFINLKKFSECSRNRIVESFQNLN